MNKTANEDRPTPRQRTPEPINVSRPTKTREVKKAEYGNHYTIGFRQKGQFSIGQSK